MSAHFSALTMVAWRVGSRRAAKRLVRRARRLAGPFVRMYRRDAVMAGLSARCEMERERRLDTRCKAVDMVLHGDSEVMEGEERWDLIDKEMWSYSPCYTSLYVGRGSATIHAIDLLHQVLSVAISASGGAADLGSAITCQLNWKSEPFEPFDVKTHVGR